VSEEVPGAANHIVAGELDSRATIQKFRIVHCRGAL